MITLRPATEADIPAIVALNEAVVDVTSPMDADRFGDLWRLSDTCLVAERAGETVGFCLAMADGAAYRNANFDWFSARLRNFVYVDRIVVAQAGRGTGLGRRLYEALFEKAAADGHLSIAAEIDVLPPNTGSLDFHDRLGFVEIGRRTYDTGKVVSMQVRAL